MIKQIIKIMVVVLILSVCAITSWAIVCGVIKLITMCFGIDFSFKVATGIWLTFILIKFYFGPAD